ncbi:MAG: hypothetical protein JRG94_12740 [Deltaproteobacteria bacterium]|nr:hypothetical protein [Deltaproteobacteria bacterium]
MLRWIATVIIVLLFVLNLALPGTSIGRRGSETQPRMEVPEAAGEIGKPLPSFQLKSIGNEVIDSSQLLGHRVLLIFERSVDW